MPPSHRHRRAVRRESSQAEQLPPLPYAKAPPSGQNTIADRPTDSLLPRLSARTRPAAAGAYTDVLPICAGGFCPVVPSDPARTLFCCIRFLLQSFPLSERPALQALLRCSPPAVCSVWSEESPHTHRAPFPSALRCPLRLRQRWRSPEHRAAAPDALYRRFFRHGAPHPLN